PRWHQGRRPRAGDRGAGRREPAADHAAGDRGEYGLNGRLATAASVANVATQTCYRHPNRETGVSCSSCGRPICTDCMTPTNVGMRCPDCAKQRTKVVRMREMARAPRVTYALIAINVLVFLAERGQLSLSGSELHGTVVNEGFLDRATISLAHQYWRLVTYAFIHENFLHVFFNMCLLYVIGTML